ncbi:glycosyltransferase [Pedobacter sp. PAMC26386]|nr:glycosyltransferase [Pedobacter sp. PAMC26386]
MRIAHIIIAHKNPAQLERLIRAMRHPQFDFYIHLDQKVNMASFKYLEQLEQVYFIINRTVCTWGGFSIVEATIRSIDEVQQKGIVYDFLNLISGQDYPVKPTDVIYDFFNKYQGYSFISFDNSNDTSWWNEAVGRYEAFHFTDMDFRGKYFVQRVVNSIVPKRKFPVSLDLYGGNKSGWWTVTSDCAAYVSAYFKANPKMISFLRMTWGCDEFVVASILMNSQYQDKLINENHRYIDWTENEAHPKILTTDDFPQIIESGMLFARKFDLEADANVLDLLDLHVIDAN